MTDIFKRLLTHINMLHQQLHKAWIASLAMALLVVACGGGGDTSASVGSGGTGAFSTTAYSEGAITGFGSILVNGKAFDERFASVSDEEGPRTLADLKLGMVVQVTGHVSSDGKASADTIKFDSKLRGPISAIENNTTTLTILGQKVKITNHTVLDRAFATLGLGSFKVGDVLEVHGYLNPVDNTLQATLIELPSRAVSVYKLSGLVSNINITERTMQVGTETIDLSSLSDEFISVLMVGSFARLTLIPNAPQGTQGWAIRTLGAEYSNSTSQSIAEVEGVVTQVTSSTEFKLNNTPVDTRSAVLPGGGVKVGDIVNVKGELVNGRLIATEVRQVPPITLIEVSGLISQIDKTSNTFFVRGVCILFESPVIYENGSEADLANGINVRIKGVGVPFSHEVRATVITFVR
jgi:Domain of unknown function (DUF5666)